MVVRWIVFVHVAAALFFMLAHGASAAIAFRLRRERDLQRIATLLDLSRTSYLGISVTILALLATGIALGFLGSWWGKGWIWASLALFFLITFAMTPLVAVPYNEVRRMLGLKLPTPTREPVEPPSEPPSPDDIARILAGPRPMAAAVLGLVGIPVILWLMMFRPF